MKGAVFVPCFIDAFYPGRHCDARIAVAPESRRGLSEEQTCCGQPMANSGAHKDAAGAEAVFVANFAGDDYIVGPSASCIHHVRSQPAFWNRQIRLSLAGRLSVPHTRGGHESGEPGDVIHGLYEMHPRGVR
ncbi:MULTISPECIES: heterodisulfide reductase-related iron-sulfur binding cluster [unclassified Mesorhizobium]|uniref:heterodisulfide reductase-related iron-sulfur binding cluster n=1 Tax=unclassified Mesorhizobium TaxID=325217 RepID=UPI0009FBB6CA